MMFAGFRSQVPPRVRRGRTASGSHTRKRNGNRLSRRRSPCRLSFEPPAIPKASSCTKDARRQPAYVVDRTITDAKPRQKCAIAHSRYISAVVSSSGDSALKAHRPFQPLCPGFVPPCPMPPRPSRGQRTYGVPRKVRRVQRNRAGGRSRYRQPVHFFEPRSDCSQE